MQLIPEIHIKILVTSRKWKENKTREQSKLSNDRLTGQFIGKVLKNK